MLKASLSAVFLFAAAACRNNGRVTTPTPPPASVAGNWSGTWTSSLPNDDFFTAAIGMQLAQAGSAVSGTWATSQAHGTVSGTTATTSFSGTFTWNATSPTDRTCTGTFEVVGTVGEAMLRFTSVGPNAGSVNLVSGDCTDVPYLITITVQSQ